MNSYPQDTHCKSKLLGYFPRYMHIHNRCVILGAYGETVIGVFVCFVNGNNCSE